jgi:hypothetical protein
MRSAAGKLWQGWKRVAARVGNFQARLLLSLFYFVVFAPFALAVRWGSDPLGIKKGVEPQWRPPAENQGTPLERAMRQY